MKKIHRELVRKERVRSEIHRRRRWLVLFGNTYTNESTIGSIDGKRRCSLGRLRCSFRCDFRLQCSENNLPHTGHL